MGKNNSLTDFLADIANAIRAKKGTSDPINAQDFATEISTITGGADAGDSTSDIEYLDIREHLLLIDILGPGISSMKVLVENATIPIEGYICGGLYCVALNMELQQMGAKVTPIAIAVDKDMIISMKQNGTVVTQTTYEVLVSKGESYVEEYNSLPRLTKEQFYSFD